MAKPPTLPAVIAEVCRKHKFHTLILYGSYARGDATATSDFDVLAIRKGTGKAVHESRKWKGVYLDVFVYPEAKIAPKEFLRIRGGKIIIQSNGYGTRLLKKVERIFGQGPKRLPREEIDVRKTWFRKMMERLQRGDLEGNFRRAWLLTALLEEYFVFRHRWYEGSKASFAWLRSHDRETLSLFERALKPNAKVAAIERLVAKVIGR